MTTAVQPDNGIPIISWFSDRSDVALLGLMPFLTHLSAVADVRPVIRSHYGVRKRLNAYRKALLNAEIGSPAQLAMTTIHAEDDTPYHAAP